MLVTKRVRYVVGAVVLLVFSALIGCNPVDPMVFHDKVVDQLNKLKTAIATLKEPTKAARGGQPGGADALKSAYDGMEKSIGEVKKELSEMRTPSDEKAKAFYAAAMKYVETMDSAMKEEFPQIMNVYCDASLSPDEKRARTKSLNEAITAKQRSAADVFNAANEELAKALNLPLPQGNPSPPGQ